MAAPMHCVMSLKGQWFSIIVASVLQLVSLTAQTYPQRELLHSVQTSVHIGLFNSATEFYLNQTLVV